MENVRYRDAMAETLYYLRGIRVEDLKKIPPKLLKYIHKNANKSYVCKFDYNKPLKDMDISLEAKSMIGMICLNYIYDDDEKEKVVSILKENDKLFYEEQNKKYNPNNIFSKSKTAVEDKATNEMLPIEIKKKSFFDRIKAAIKRICRK